jgi:hypothetical protein
VGCQVVIA